MTEATAVNIDETAAVTPAVADPVEPTTAEEAPAEAAVAAETK